jgi:cation transport protein ChaC
VTAGVRAHGGGAPEAGGAVALAHLYPHPGRYLRLDDDERELRLQQLMRSVRCAEEVWVFAYGSLMTRPAFEPVEEMPVHLPGFRRRFTFWTCSARGSPQAPGLGLGIEPATTGCSGVAQRLCPRRRDAQLGALWEREMGAGVYAARWVNVYRSSGAALRALAFVADAAHPQFAAEMPEEHQARVIAAARGEWGSCRDYLAGVVQALARLRRPDGSLESLLAAVDRWHNPRATGEV